MNGEQADRERRLYNHASLRVAICSWLTLGMVVFTGFIFFGGVQKDYLYLWLVIITLWILGAPTPDEQRAVKNITERDKRNGRK